MYRFVYSWYHDHSHTFSSKKNQIKCLKNTTKLRMGGERRIQIDAKCFALWIALGVIKFQKANDR